MEYRYETHCHSAQCSACAISSAQALVHAYHAAGYAGLVLTDHFIFGNTAVPSSLPWQIRMERYYQAYLDAKAAAEGLDFDVIFGLEHAYGDGKEILIYGVELDFLLANPDIPRICLDEFVSR
ncbi:MAG: histidinol-phosphatase, partial [Lachnospiraceae bacterium]|nr:histidinol-phosphatase [Lachnospiraceae bacterium]